MDPMILKKKYTMKLKITKNYEIFKNYKFSIRLLHNKNGTKKKIKV